MRKQNTIIWHHFNKNDNRHATCNYCKKVLSYAATTGNLKKHLRLKHPPVFSSLKQGSTEANESDGQRQLKFGDETSSSDDDVEDKTVHPEYSEPIKTRKRYCEIWNHFDKCVGVDKVATCKYCKKILSYKGTTTNLRTHLKLKHPSVHSKLTRGSPPQTSEGGGLRKFKFHDESSSDSSDGDAKTTEHPKYSNPIRKRPYNVVWDHFDKCAGGVEEGATCRYCKKILSYKCTTNNLKTHLKFKHSYVYSKLKEGLSASASQNDMIQGPSLEVGDWASTSGVRETTIHAEYNSDLIDDLVETYEIVIPTMTKTEALSSDEPSNKVQCMSLCLPMKNRGGDKKDIDKNLVKLIAYDCQPFTILDDIGFIEFVHALNPNYQLPSRNTVSSTLLPAFYEERRQHLISYVKENAESVCLTIDCWLSRTTDLYMGVTAHFFSKDLKMKSILLQCVQLDGSQAGQRIAQELGPIVETWGISDKVLFLVTNNASNMFSASRILNWNHFVCFEHKLNLVVQCALSTNKEIIEKVTKTVNYYQKSGAAKEKLMKYQLNQNILQPRTLIKTVSTRWNSTYLMLERFNSLKEAIEATVALLNISLPIILDEEWDCIAQMCVILKPFHEVSNVMSGENYLTASTAMVLTSSLMSICESMSALKDFRLPVKDMLGKLNQGLTQRFGDIQSNLHIALCTLLDPRYKDVAFTDTQSLEQIKKYASTLMESLLTDDNTPVGQSQQTSDSVVSIWTEFDLKITSSNAPRTAETKAQEELEMFLKESVINRKLCPFTWWQTHKCIYPTVYKVFKTNCNIVVTSVACERAFSKTGYIVNERRNRLTTSKVDQIMFLNVNKME